MSQPIANVALSDTFDVWRIRTNSIAYRLTVIDAGTANNVGATYATFGTAAIPVLSSNTTATFTGSATFSGNTVLGSIGNVHISGGSNGNVVKTNGSGVLSFGSVALSEVSGTLSNAQFANSHIINNLSVANGTVSAPVIRLGGDATSGLYRSASNEIAATISSTQRLKITSTGITVTGAVSATSFSGDGSGLTGVATEASSIAYAIALG